MTAVVMPASALARQHADAHSLRRSWIFKTARLLALDDDLAVLRAQLDLANVPARTVNFLGDQRRALWASASFAPRTVAASVDANSRRRRFEIGLQHVSIYFLDPL